MERDSLWARIARFANHQVTGTVIGTGIVALITWLWASGTSAATKVAGQSMSPLAVAVVDYAVVACFAVVLVKWYGRRVIASINSAWTAQNAVALFIAPHAGTALTIDASGMLGTLECVGWSLANGSPFAVRVTSIRATWYANMAGGTMKGTCAKDFSQAPIEVSPRSTYASDGATSLGSVGESQNKISGHGGFDTIVFDKCEVTVVSHQWREAAVEAPRHMATVRVY